MAQQNPKVVVKNLAINSNFVCGASNITQQTTSAAATGVKQYPSIQTD